MGNMGVVQSIRDVSVEIDNTALIGALQHHAAGIEDSLATGHAQSGEVTVTIGVNGEMVTTAISTTVCNREGLVYYVILQETGTGRRHRHFVIERVLGESVWLPRNFVYTTVNQYPPMVDLLQLI